MYVILGASGNTGKVVAETLLDSGQKVRVVGRNKGRLEGFTVLGADVFEANVTDSAALTTAFTGARAVYALVPPDLASKDYRADQDAASASIAKALEASGVTHVVALSSFGADKLDKTGPVAGLHIMEERFSQIPKLNALFLRAGYFMENLLAQAGIIKNFGMMAGPVDADMKLPMIATYDIAVAAAEALAKLDFAGHQTRELHGQRDLNYLEMAKIVGAAIGIPNLTYVQLPADQVIQAMTQMGISKNMATLICEMADALNSGHMRMLEARSAANTTPTQFEEFVHRVFVPAYKGQATSA
ncbi:MAG TPA: NAD(P)H-binding protein [Candidatus Acidoferrum sp.]|nr:NAD(P)H-binding protein [Candidatus Acidoferrum sp.]